MMKNIMNMDMSKTGNRPLSHSLRVSKHPPPAGGTLFSKEGQDSHIMSIASPNEKNLYSSAIAVSYA